MRMTIRNLAAIAVATLVWGCSSETADQVDAPATSASVVAPASLAGERPRPSREEQLHPKVVVTTSAGEFTLKLDAEHAPITVANFLEYVDRHFYDDTIFHQVSEGYVVQGGGFTPALEEKPAGPAIRNEAHNGLTNRRGTIAMARAADMIDSSTSQFFINLGDNASLDHQSTDVEGYGYCVFGEVVAGLETVDRIGQSPVEAEGGKPVETVRVKSVRRLQ